jgi:glycosyltransferase involved in cell wall biosynthesis
MKVTVILPLHNSEKYLKECMNSITNQTLHEIEVICIDSGIDKTADIIHSYAENDRRIKYIYDENSSYGYKINKGIELAQGKYVAIVESDDYIKDDMIQILYEQAEENQVDIVRADYRKFIDINGNRIESEVKCSSSQRLYNHVINMKEEPETKNYLGYSIWASLYKKSFLNANQLHLNETPGASYQDTGFAVLVALKAQKIYFTNHQLYRYRIDNKDSSVKSQEKNNCIIEEFNWIKKQMQLIGLNKEEDIVFYKDKKLISYFWNYQRLLPEYQEKFLDEIHEEIECEFLGKTFYMKGLSFQQVDAVKILHGEVDSIDKFEQDSFAIQENFRQVASVFETKDKIVIFGAGKYGEALVELNHILNKDNIVAICDNDIRKHNMKIRGVPVQNPLETVLAHKSAFYVIANKKNGKEILTQLKEYGIFQDSIYISEILPGKTVLLEAVLELI